MRTVQSGDSVRVHYVKRFQDGSVASSRGRVPVELTVGIDHPRLRGLGLALVGLAPGEGTQRKRQRGKESDDDDYQRRLGCLRRGSGALVRLQLADALRQPWPRPGR